MKFVDIIGRLSKITQTLSLHLLANHLANDSSTLTDLCDVLLLFRHQQSQGSFELTRQKVLKTCSHALSICRLLFKVARLVARFHGLSLFVFEPFSLLLLIIIVIIITARWSLTPSCFI